MPQPNLLIIDDDPIICQLLDLKAKHYGFRPVIASGGLEGVELYDDQLDAILLDIQMPDVDGFETLELLNAKGCQVPVIIISGNNEVEYAVRAVKLGAMDYICKPFDLDELFTKLRNAKTVSGIKKENRELRDSITPSSGSPNLVAHSDKTRALILKAQRVAASDSTVLITGESGTGKGVFAHFLHANSLRSSKPFITVSCSAFPRELLESEIFGHEKGAFTGAAKKRVGKVETAKGGTLFIDDIGDLPVELQVKLLSVIENQEYTRIGSDEPVKSDIRVVGAATVDLEERMKQGEFCEDLYHKLSVTPLDLGSLRDRPEEIIPLAEYFLERISVAKEAEPMQLSSDAQEMLREYHWPGNIRQLENIIERVSIYCKNHLIDKDDLTEVLSATDADSVPISGLAGHTLSSIEAQAIAQTLKSCKGNRAESARKLGISEKSIYNKIKKYSINA